jgi:hypothetical protein
MVSLSIRRRVVVQPSTTKGRRRGSGTTERRWHGMRLTAARPRCGSERWSTDGVAGVDGKSFLLSVQTTSCCIACLCQMSIELSCSSILCSTTAKNCTRDGTVVWCTLGCLQQLTQISLHPHFGKEKSINHVSNNSRRKKETPSSGSHPIMSSLLP